MAGTWTIANSAQAGSGTIQGSASIFVRSDGTDTVFVPLSQFTGTLSTVVDSLGRFTFQANILQGQTGTTQGGSAQFVVIPCPAVTVGLPGRRDEPAPHRGDGGQERRVVRGVGDDAVARLHRVEGGDGRGCGWGACAAGYRRRRAS